MLPTFSTFATLKGWRERSAS